MFIGHQPLIGRLGTYEYIAYVTSNVNNLNVQTLFTAGQWSDNIPKRVIIMSGVTVGSTSAATASLRTGTGRGNTMSITNLGSILAAGGGASTRGGTAVLIEQAGVSFYNKGLQYGGGGGGGTGGTGGQGYYDTPFTNQEGPANSSSRGYYVWTHKEGDDNSEHPFPSFVWNNITINNTGANGFLYGGSTYYQTNTPNTLMPGPQFNGVQVYRTFPDSTRTITSGGGGGTGGRGQGSDGAAASGVVGAAGATYAGQGGFGGTGGTYGTGGAVGNNGGTGNYTGGAGGTAGGAAGRYFEGFALLAQWVNTGTVLGTTS